MGDVPEFERVLKIVNTKGLHARASAKFVQTAAKFRATIIVTKDGSSVAGTSIMGLMMLGAGMGSEVKVGAHGDDAMAAIDALDHLVTNRFGEET